MSRAGLFSGQQIWTASQINLSDADPASLAGISTPLSQLASLTDANRTSAAANAAKVDLASGIANLFAESGSFAGEHGSLQSKQLLHDSHLLHSGDTEPLRLYAREGSVSGLALFSPKRTQIFAAGDISDIGFYLQNLNPSDVSFIASGGTITAYDPLSPLQSLAKSDNVNNLVIPIQSGDIQGSGPGTFEILARKNIDLGNGLNNADGTGVGITSVGNSRNPGLPFYGADIVVAAGVDLGKGLSGIGVDTQNLITKLQFSDKKDFSDIDTYFGQLVFKAAGVSIYDFKIDTAASPKIVTYFQDRGISNGLDELVANLKEPLLSKYNEFYKYIKSLNEVHLTNYKKEQLLYIYTKYITYINYPNQGPLTTYEKSLLAQYILLDPDMRPRHNFLNETTASAGSINGILRDDLLAEFKSLSVQQVNQLRDLLGVEHFFNILRNSGTDVGNPDASVPNYSDGDKAISIFFSQTDTGGSVTTWSRDIRTKNSGNITIIAPLGGLTLANTAIGSTLAPPGIVTEHGGAIDIYTQQKVDIGIGRIFTLRGGDITIWSDKGDIAAGFSAKTVASAPPTRVLIDPQSLNVLTDLAGLATGGGIGELDTVEGVPLGTVSLIAPKGAIDAGDAGIVAKGNLVLVAPVIKGAGNISGGATVGAPAAAPPAAPSASGATAASTASAANNASAQQIAKQAVQQADDSPSLFDIEVLGYGGGDGGESDDFQKKASAGGTLPPQASL
jgi:hypothetical protein